MNAKEMFEELGYEKIENNRHITYNSKNGCSISFWKGFKEFSHGDNEDITMDEFKAIHQQLIELGWI